jgi:hypothetical protein|tara:strand:+ start:79 stop:555 length:477 start_codon:yes stop_codon:yes gene_type:complete
MIDPISCIAGATAAYNGIKKACEMGKEISSFTGAISKFAKASSDIDFLEQKAKNPSLYHKLFSNHQADALDIWSKRQKLKEMRTEIQNHISFVYGPSAWKEILRIEAQQRKQQRALVYAKQEFKDNLINGILITLIISVGLAIAGGVIWFIGNAQGKW